jgi:hypothetical protein
MAGRLANPPDYIPGGPVLARLFTLATLADALLVI